MRKTRFTGEQIVAFLKEGEAGVKVAELCRKHGISDATYYNWKAKFAGMSDSAFRRKNGAQALSCSITPMAVSSTQIPERTLSPWAVPSGCRRIYQNALVLFVTSTGVAIPVDGRAERIFGAEKAKRILKVFHYFSHASNIEQISKNNDLMCDIEGAAADLMKHLTEMDLVHLEALNAAVGTSPYERGIRQTFREDQVSTVHG